MSEEYKPPPEVIGLANTVVTDHIIQRIMKNIACGCHTHMLDARSDINWVLGKRADEQTVQEVFKACTKRRK